MTKTRSGRMTKAPARYGTSDDDATRTVAKRKTVAATKKKSQEKAKKNAKTTTKTVKKTASSTRTKKVATPAKRAAKEKETKKKTTAAETKTKTKTKTKKSTTKKVASKYALKPGTKKEAVLPDVSSSLSKAVRDELDSMSVTDLKNVLKLNDCVCTGTKEELRVRVAWGIKNGVPKRCPSCYSGRLKLDIHGNYFCPGAYDDDHYVRCSYETSKPEMVPWKKEKSLI